MATTNITDAVVFPQDEGEGIADGSQDYNSAGHIGQPRPPVPCLLAGVGLTPDYTVPDVDISPGAVQVTQSGVSVQSGSDSTHDTTLPDDEYQTIQIPTSITVSLDASALNEIWIAHTPGSQDDVYVKHGSGLSAPTDPSVKIGEVDTSSDTKSEQWSLLGDDGTLTYPDEASLSEVAGSLQSGTALYDRTNDTLWRVS